MISVAGGYNNWWQLDLDIKPVDTVLNWSFNHQTVKHMTIEEAAKYTVNIIANKYDNLHLLMSGGFDSEFVANMLYHNQIPFTPVVGVVSYTSNHDYFYAMHWCNTHNVNPLVVKFEVDDIDLQKDYATVCKKYGLINDVFTIKPLIDVVTSRSGNVLLGEVNLTSESWSHGWDDPIGEDLEIAAHSFFGSIYTNGTQPCEVLSYTPELLLALIKNLDTSLNNALAKTKLYDIEFRPKTWPVQTLSPEIKHRVQKICGVENYPKKVFNSCPRRELISKLCKN